MRGYGRLTAVAVLLLASFSQGAPPRLKLPAEVKPTGEYATLQPDTDGVSVTYVGLSGYDPFPSGMLKDAKIFLFPVRGLAVGRYKFAAIAAGDKGDQARADFEVVVGDSPPTPPSPPGPGPGPDPKPPPGPVPIPGDGMRVLMLYETGELSKYPAAQRQVIYSAAVRDYLNAKCPVGPDGKTKEWRAYDPDTDLGGESKLWQDAIKRKRDKLPWIIISNGKTGFEGPLPATTDETLTLLKKYGG